MIRISDIKVSTHYTYNTLLREAALALHVGREQISSLSIYKRSLDARKKDSIKYILTVDVSVTGDEELVISKCGSNKITEAKYITYSLPEPLSFKKRPIVVGFGPAGIFASLILSMCGANPIVFERGAAVEDRKNKVEKFFTSRELDTETNIQFGEGGAGTFSDGKLNTGVKDPRIKMVLETFAKNGAPEEILYEAKPHIGTDKLPGTIKNIRNKIISMGGEVHFNALVTDFQIKDGKITGIWVRENGSVNLYETDSVILAIGHSSRDTFKKLNEKNIPIEPKAFSVGARIEHPREYMDKLQYGPSYGKAQLPTADYKLAAHLKNGRGVYTFCMCPGGTVVGATSWENSVVTNGMSTFARNADNSNSALLVGISPEDFFADSPLDGMYFQEKIERKAFEVAGKNYNAPAQRLEDFMVNRPTTKLGDTAPSYSPGTSLCKLSDVLPEFIIQSMKMGITDFGGKIRGFNYPDAVLTGPETRSSSPIRILRNDLFESVGIKGLYPCGEGAGYAGGITSAAVDGIRCAEAVILSEK